MNAFHRYFLGYVFHAKTRQGLLFLALIGLFLSSSALLIIQGVMGGLQRGLIARSHAYHGVGQIRFDDPEMEKDLFQKAKLKNWSITRELEMELLARNGAHVAPIIVHGIDPEAWRPEFLKKKDLTGIILGVDLAQKLKTSFFKDIRLISPSATDALMGEVPRQLSIDVSDYVLADVPEIDSLNAWVRLSFIQNLLRIRGVNRWRFYSQDHWSEAKSLFSQQDLQFISWEDQHKTLVWALALETKVMIALFVSMALLVALSITTGLFLFFNKIRQDLASFWLLGLSLKRIHSLVFKFIMQLSAVACLSGLFIGVCFLFILEKFGHNLMPDIFVERTFPVHISLLTLGIAFLVPYSIAVIFSYFSFVTFRKDNPQFIQLVRGAADTN